MRPRALQPSLAWTEDTALLKSNRSAGQAPRRMRAARSRPSPSSGSAPSDKLSRHDAATHPTGCRPLAANANHPKFQFTVNQDTIKSLDRLVPSTRLSEFQSR
jgi:hypothetical protein